jgi:hypothetical protein
MAQQGAGDTELQLQGSLSLATSGAKDSAGGANALVGRFFTDRQEAGVSLAASIFQGNKLVGLAGVFYRYNFSSGQIVPYVGASAADSFGSTGNVGSSTGLLLTFEGGFRYFIDRRTAFSVEASEGYSTKDKEFGKQLTVLFGFSHLWGK